MEISADAMFREVKDTDRRADDTWATFKKLAARALTGKNLISQGHGVGITEQQGEFTLNFNTQRVNFDDASDAAEAFKTMHDLLAGAGFEVKVIHELPESDPRRGLSYSTTPRSALTVTFNPSEDLDVATRMTQALNAGLPESLRQRQLA